MPRRRIDAVALSNLQREERRQRVTSLTIWRAYDEGKPLPTGFDPCGWDYAALCADIGRDAVFGVDVWGRYAPARKVRIRRRL